MKNYLLAIITISFSFSFSANAAEETKLSDRPTTYLSEDTVGTAIALVWANFTMAETKAKAEVAAQMKPDYAIHDANLKILFREAKLEIAIIGAKYNALKKK